MLSTAVLLMMSREKRGLTIVGIFLLLVVVAVIAWNLVP